MARSEGWWQAGRVGDRERLDGGREGDKTTYTWPQTTAASAIAGAV